MVAAGAWPDAAFLLLGAAFLEAGAFFAIAFFTAWVRLTVFLAGALAAGFLAAAFFATAFFAAGFFVAAALAAAASTLPSWA
ncbi:hypothetical protein C1704_02760 [Caldimonas caldifontis]|uniref:Uncharacterized protein n=1 Tax=Caldimonas caldifontis TaxID=1452508 RepID=A0A2S5SYJ6_9BURK|nr:hypothetical protein C1704_02760 [Caldimonas caldifontis]